MQLLAFENLIRLLVSWPCSYNQRRNHAYTAACFDHERTISNSKLSDRECSSKFQCCTDNSHNLFQHLHSLSNIKYVHIPVQLRYQQLNSNRHCHVAEQLFGTVFGLKLPRIFDASSLFFCIVFRGCLRPAQYISTSISRQF